ncbi:Ig-like domain-containing protein [Exiguobacterium sp. 22311]
MRGVEAAVDVTKPTFESISVDKKDVKVGDTVEVTVKAKDTDSGIKSITVYYALPQVEQSKGISMWYDTEKEAYVGQITMTEDMPSGIFKPTSLIIYDNANNSLYLSIYNTFFGGESEFELTGTTADVTKPTFESITVDKKDVKVGDTVEVTVKAKDTDSGIKSVTVYYALPQVEQSKGISMWYDTEKEAYVGQITMAEDMPSGIFKPTSLIIYDNANNSLYLSIYNTFFGGESEFELTGTTADVTKPTFESITVDKKDVKVGDTVEVTVKAKDTDSGIKSVTVYYALPQVEQSKGISMWYDTEKEAYVGQITMTEDMPSGIFKPTSLIIYDNANNSLYLSIYNAFFGEESEFVLNDYQADMLPPVFESLSLSQSVLDQTQPLEIKVKATDDTKVKNVKITSRHNNSKKEQVTTLFPSTERDEYQASIQINDNLEAGQWTISSVEIEDLNGNKTLVTDGLNDYTFTVFPRIQTLGKTFYTENTSLMYTTISGDIYIGPQAVVSLSGTTIYGNVYVLGAMRSYGGLRVTGTIYANSFSFGSSSLYQGGVVFSGSNSVSGMVASNDPLNRNIPFKLYEEPIVETDGKVTLSGATVPVVDVTLEGEKLNINTDGTFRVKDYPIGIKRKLTFEFRDIFGNAWTKTYDVFDRSKPVVTPSLSSGIYAKGRILSLNATKNAKIYYTTDGLDPTDMSQVFNGETEVHEGVNLRYVAIDALNIQSDVGELNLYTYEVEPFLEESNTIKGTGTPGMNVNVLKDGKSIANTVIDSSGQFKIKVDQQKVGTRLVVRFEINGLENDEYNFVVEDHIAPLLKLPLETTDDVLQLKGESESGSTVTIYDTESKEKQLGKGTTGVDGKFSIPFERPSGNALYVVSTDASGNASKPQKVTLKDVTAPTMKLPAETSDDVLQLKGESESGATVTIYDTESKEKQLGKGAAGVDGKFSISFERPSGNALYVVSTDASGNASKPQKVTLKDVTAPTMKLPAETSDDVLQLKGESESGATVTIYDTESKEKQLGKGTAGVDGKFNISFERPSGNALYVVSTDASGNASKPQKVTLKDVTAPTMKLPSETSDDVLQLKGESESGATVTIYNTESKEKQLGKGTAGVDGKFNISFERPSGNALYVVSTDASGNASKPQKVTLKDVTAPTMKLPVETSDDVLQLKGESESGATVTIYDTESKEKQLGKGTAGVDGKFNISFERPSGNALYVVSTDASGNASKPQKVTLKDVTAPTMKLPVETSDDVLQLKGESESGATVTIYDTESKEKQLGKGAAGVDGKFSISFNRPQGNTLYVVATDAFGNVSKPQKVMLKDVTAPVKPVIDQVTNQSTRITGQVEPGARVTLLIGKTIVELTADQSGRFTYLTSPLAAGTVIKVSTTDAAGNKSEQVEQRVSDVIKPIISGVTKTTIDLGQTFNPFDRVTATDETDGNLTSKIKITGAVDSKRVGNYTLIYTVMDQAGNIVKASRVITVQDSIKPVISGAKDITVALNQKFDVRKGVSAKDNVDGMLTKSIKVSGSVNSKKIGTYKLTYSVSDKAGNQTIVTRKVIVKDMTKPVIIGATTKTIKYKSSFNPMRGVSAKDNVDGSLTKKIKVSGTVNTKKKGAYYLTYRVSDKGGNQISIKRKIIVK